MHIITHELLNNIEKNDELKIIKKEQTGSFSGTNFFITPTLSIKLYKPKVIFVNPKTITLEMSKINTGLLSLLRRCDKMIMDKISDDIPEFDEKIKYNIFYENEKNNTICLRCYLPSFNNSYKTKYFIKYMEEGNETYFKLPRINMILDEAVLDIRNIWCNNKLGYNLELKYIHVY